MRSMLKALGLTIWGLVALGLLAIFMFVGYELARKYRATNDSAAESASISNDKTLSTPQYHSDHTAAASAVPYTPDSTRKFLEKAVQKSRQQGSDRLWTATR